MNVHVVHLDDVTPEEQDASQGWQISEFRLPITGRHGSSSTLFHSRFRPGSIHKKHRHYRSTEFVVYLSGDALVGGGADRYRMPAMAFRAVPPGVEHFFFNDTRSGVAEMVGLYVGASDLPDSGYEFAGDVSPADVRAARMGSLNEARHPSGRIETRSGLQALLHTIDPVPSCAFFRSWHPGEARSIHLAPTAELIAYMVSGGGQLGHDGDLAPMRTGHVLFMPPGESRTLRLDSEIDLNIVGFLTGSTTPEAAGITTLVPNR